jgi:hypothetical protein
VAVTQAFLNNHETEFRKAAQAMGFLPLIVTVPTRQAAPKAIGKPIVRPPDVVETVETRYKTQYPFWPKPSVDRTIPPTTAKQPPVKSPALDAKREEIMTVEIRLTFADASSVAATLNKLYHDNLTIVADQRLNSLIARGTAAVIEEVSDLVKKLDSAQRSAKAPEIIPLEDARSKSSDRHAAEIDRLRNEYKASEKAAQKTAGQIRSSGLDSDDTRLAELKRQLRAQVALSFRIRQDLNQAELDDMKRELRDADEMIRQRNTIKEQIIDRRVIDLMNPKLKWDEPADHTLPIDPTNSQRPNLKTSAESFPVGVQLLLPEGLALRTRPNEPRPLPSRTALDRFSRVVAGRGQS